MVYDFKVWKLKRTPFCNDQFIKPQPFKSLKSSATFCYTMTWSFTIMNCWKDNRAYKRNDTILSHSVYEHDTYKNLIHLKTIAYSHGMLLWCGHNKMIMRMGVLTALLSLLRCATVLLDMTSLQNVGEQLTQQHTKSSQKTGMFTLNTFKDYLLSVNWLTF